MGDLIDRYLVWCAQHGISGWLGVLVFPLLGAAARGLRRLWQWLRGCPVRFSDPKMVLLQGGPRNWFDPRSDVPRLTSEFDLRFSVACDVAPVTKARGELRFSLEDIKTDWRLRAYLVLDQAKLEHRIGRGEWEEGPLRLANGGQPGHLTLRAIVPVKLGEEPRALEPLAGLSPVTVVLRVSGQGRPRRYVLTCSATPVQQQIREVLHGKLSRLGIGYRYGNAFGPDQAREYLAAIWSLYDSDP